MPNSLKLVTAFAITISVASTCFVNAQQRRSPAPKAVLTGGTIEELQALAQGMKAEVTLRQSKDASQVVAGWLLGMDGDWVVLRVDKKQEGIHRSEIHWFPLSNVERIVQFKIADLGPQ